MRGCPFPCKGYAPIKAPQEVHLLGAEWYRGDVCPGAVVIEDPTVTTLLRDYQVLDQFARGNTLTWWDEQPAWWCSGILTLQGMRDTIEREALKRDE